MPTLIEALTISELEEGFSRAYNQLYNDFYQEDSVPWLSEIIESLAAFVKCLGYNLDRYELGEDSNRSYIQCSPPDGNEDVGGVRAHTYVINSLEHYRVPYGCRHKKYKEYSRYGKAYRAGNIKPGPFTGYYMDEVLIEEVLKSSLKGDMLVESLNNLSYVISDEIAADARQHLFKFYEDCLFTVDDRVIAVT